MYDLRYTLNNTFQYGFSGTSKITWLILHSLKYTYKFDLKARTLKGRQRNTYE